MFSRYYMDSDVFNRYKSSTTQWCVARREGLTVTQWCVEHVTYVSMSSDEFFFRVLLKFGSVGYRIYSILRLIPHKISKLKCSLQCFRQIIIYGFSQLQEHFTTPRSPYVFTFFIQVNTFLQHTDITFSKAYEGSFQASIP